MDNHLSACQESQSQIEAVIRFHLIVHQAGTCRIMVRTPAAETIRHTDDGMQTGNGVLHYRSCIVAGGILGHSQFGILLILAFGDIVTCLLYTSDAADE